MKIGVLSDTHGYLDEQLFSFFSDCDEIWHAGDIGNLDVVIRLQKFKPLIAVYGNIDGADIRIEFGEHIRVQRETINIWMTHIGGYPGNYDRKVKDLIKSDPPDLFISGHSHILKVIPDKKLGLLHINPGAAGYNGIHKVRTAIRFDITNQKVANLDIIELGQRSLTK
jgi:hypothetical protein